MNPCLTSVPSGDGALASVVPAAQTTGGKAQRVAALDFTKGTLVLLMVLYHWLNYFVSLDGSYYKYLRFLTPSFIFITGFLVSHVYLRKYRITDPRLPKRLLERGLKLVAVFLALNLVIGFLIRGGFEAPLSQWEFYFTGSAAGKRASFAVLLPIGYVLLGLAGLTVLARFYKNAIHAVTALLLVSLIALSFAGSSNAMLELIGIGLLGASIGHLQMDWSSVISRRLFALLLAYAGYLCAITILNEIFVLQIVGVCLTLAIIYRIGGSSKGPASIWNPVLLLGRYSLLAYIVHVFILQTLRAAARLAGAGIWAAGLSLIAAGALTLLSVAVVDRARAKFTFVNRLYAAVFA
jgi:Acyltransferase family.